MNYINSVYITISLLYLNTTTLSDPNLLTLILTSPLVYKTNYIQNSPFYALIDFSFTYCFINIIFMYNHNIPTFPTPPIKLNVKIEEVGLDLFFFSLFYFFSFWFILPFSIFRTTRVRVDWSCHYNSHLIAKSQDRSQDLGEFSRRFENRWCYTTWTPYVGLRNYTWLFRVGCTALSMDHL